MSVKRKSYSADFKAKLVLEVLEGEATVNEVASKYGVLPLSLRNWKKQFLENMSLAFDKSTVVKEYKDEIEALKKSKDSKEGYNVNRKRVKSYAIHGYRSPIPEA